MALSRELGIPPNLNDGVSIVEIRCVALLFSYFLLQDSVSELRRHQAEQVRLLLLQQEEKEQKMKLENLKKIEESVQRMKLEHQKKEQELKAENERVLELLIQENESQEALMLAKHKGKERAARKAEELQTEGNQPQAPECPVSEFI